MFQKLKYYHFLLFSAAFFVLMALVLPIRFEDNDDVLMLLFASGTYTGTPEFRLVFINSAYGWVLQTLYSISNKIEWYTVLFSVAHIVSLSVIVWSIFKKQYNIRLKWAFAAFFLVLEMRLIAQFQFTTTAAMLALAGLALHTLANNKWKIAAALSMFVVASLIRFEAAILVFILYSPIWIKQFVDTKSFRTFKQLFLGTLVVATFYVFNIATYTSNAEWKTYFEYNKTRGMINDNPNAESIINDLPQGITSADYSLLLNFFPDYNKINHANISSIHQSIDELSVAKKLINLVPKVAKHGLFFILLLLLAAAVFYNSKTPHDRIIIVVSYALLVCCSLLLSLGGTLKTRVFLSMMAAMVFVMLHVINWKNGKYPRYLLASIVVLTSFLFLQTLHSTIKNNRWHNNEFVQQQQLLESYYSHQHGMLTSYKGELDVEQYSPFGLSQYFFNKPYAVQGWLAGIPYNKNKIYNFEDLINENAIFVSKNSADKFLEDLQTSIASNYGIATKVSTLYENELYIITQIKKYDSIQQTLPHR